ncbi:hypothetical protein B0H13DRAFT_2421809 [Mycena leptocephala]|nr:hypothetical protein B0H13DRAFT_2421809 [Mycena leptocephala]
MHLHSVLSAIRLPHRLPSRKPLAHPILLVRMIPTLPVCSASPHRATVSSATRHHCAPLPPPIARVPVLSNPFRLLPEPEIRTCTHNILVHRTASSAVPARGALHDPPSKVVYPLLVPLLAFLLPDSHLDLSCPSQASAYDLKLETRAQAVVHKDASIVESIEYDFLVCDSAPPDMGKCISDTFFFLASAPMPVPVPPPSSPIGFDFKAHRPPPPPTPVPPPPSYPTSPYPDLSIFSTADIRVPCWQAGLAKHHFVPDETPDDRFSHSVRFPTNRSEV